MLLMRGNVEKNHGEFDDVPPGNDHRKDAEDAEKMMIRITTMMRYGKVKIESDTKFLRRQAGKEQWATSTTGDNQ